MQKTLSLSIIIGLIIISVDSIRNLPSLALFGSSLPLYFLLGTIVFLLPVCFVSAELSAHFADSENNGIYHWSSTILSKNTGMFAIWAQWGSNAIWFPANLMFIASTFLSLCIPSLSTNTSVLSITMILMFTLITAMNLFGIKQSSLIAFLCMLLGIVLPTVIVIIALVFWMIYGYDTYININVNSFIFNFNMDNVSALTAIIMSFLGIELASVHISKLKNAKSTYNRAILISSIIIILIMFSGAIAVAALIPKSQLSLYGGIYDTFNAIFDKFHLKFLMPAIMLMILLGSFGAAVTWAIGPTEGMVSAAENGFLPKLFTKRNKYSAPANMLYAQLIVVIALCIIMNFIQSLNAFYWILISFNVEIYLMMYIVMFVAAIKNRMKTNCSYMIKSNTTYYTMCVIGIFGTICAMVAGTIPASDIIKTMTVMEYAIYYITGVVLMACVTLFFIKYRSKNKFLES